MNKIRSGDKDDNGYKNRKTFDLKTVIVIITALVGGGATNAGIGYINGDMTPAINTVKIDNLIHDLEVYKDTQTQFNEMRDQKLKEDLEDIKEELKEINRELKRLRHD